MSRSEQEGEAGSFFGSESEPAAQESQLAGAGDAGADSVNYGAQSPRVPRSQISRAHPGQTLGYGERTSAVLSALSGDDETALSAAEAAGEHTSHPQLAAGPAGAQPVGPAAARAPPPPPQQQQQQQQQQQPQQQGLVVKPAAADDPLSPPESTSPMYRANSVVSHTAAPLRLPQLKRAAETPLSAPLHGALVGASPTTSRVEFSQQRPPYGPPPSRSFARPQQAQQQQQQRGQPPPPAPTQPGPSYISLSQTAPTVHTGTAGGGPLPSTLGLAIGVPPGPMFPPPGLAPISGASPAGGVVSQPANLAAWVGLAASMGVPLEVLQAQGAPMQGGQGGAAPAQLQLQQAEALQNMAAVLQAQASVILQQQQHQQQQQSQSLGWQQATPATAAAERLPAASAAPAVALPPQAHAHAPPPQQLHHQGAAAAGEASAAGPSMYSLPDLVGASVIQGHPLPPPFYGSGGGGMAGQAGRAPTLVSGVTRPGGAGGGGRGVDTMPAAPALPAVAVPAAGSSQRLEAATNRSSVSPTAAAGRDPRLQPAQAPASSMVHGQYRPPHMAGGAQLASSPCLPAAREPMGTADVAAASAGRQGSARGGGDLEAAHGMPSTDAAAIGGNLGDEAANDGGLEVQQAAPAMGAGNVPMATPDTDGSARQEPSAAQQQQQPAMVSGEARGPPGAHPVPLPPAPHGAASVMATLVSSGEQSDVESEISGMQQAVSGPHSHPAAAGDAQSPLPSMQPAAATTNAHMSLSLMAATASQPPRQQQQEHSTSGQSPPGQGAPGSRLATLETGPDDDAAGGSVDMTCPAWRQNQHQQAASEPLRAGGAAAAAGHPAASAPMVLPGQARQPDQPQPAISVSLSAQGEEGAGPAPGHFAEHNPAAAQAQSSAFVFKHQQRHSAWEEHNISMPPPAAPGAAMGEGGGQQGVEAMEEGGGSPQGSMFNAAPAASGGTARGTIVAGQAHSILTTAAAGDGEHAEVGEGEALSPLVIGFKPSAAVHANGVGLQAAPHAATSSGVGLAGGGCCCKSAGPAAAQPAAAALLPAEPMDLSTIAQDVGGTALGEEHEQTLLSGQQMLSASLQQHQQQQALHSTGNGTLQLGGGGAGGAAESVQANGDIFGDHGGNGVAAEHQGDHLAHGEVDGNAAGCGYASSVILGNGFLAGSAAALGAAALAAAAAAATGSELTSPSQATSTSGKRRQQSKRKRNGGE